MPRANESRAGLEQQDAVTSREIGERDWAAIDPMQVRTSKGVHHYFHSALHLLPKRRAGYDASAAARRLRNEQ